MGLTIKHKIVRTIAFLLLMVAGSVGSVQAHYLRHNPDSTVTFRFKAGSEDFMAAFMGNDAEITRLLQFVQDNREMIMRGRSKIYVDGFCNTMPTQAERLSLVRRRNSHVKSFIITHGMTEENFKTSNHIEDSLPVSDMVYVSFTIPVDIAAERKTQLEVRTVVSTETQVTPVVSAIEKPQTEMKLENVPHVEDLHFEAVENYALMRKGAYYVSMYANFTNLNMTNMLVEPLFEVHNIYTKNASIQAAFGYMVKKNLAVGIYGEYKLSDLRVKVSSDMLQLLIGSKTYETNNMSTGFTIGTFMKNFLPLEYSNKVFLINETSLFYGYSQSLQRNVYNDGAMVSKVFQKTHTAGIRMAVGVQYFLTRGLTMEFNIAPVAAFYTWNEVTNNETLNGKFSGGAINTILAPIDLKFGLTYIFGLDYKAHGKYVSNYLNRAVFDKKVLDR